MVTGGYDRREAMDGWVLYLSLMSLAAWRGEAERGRKKERYGAKRKLSCSPSCCHLTHKVAARCVKVTGSTTPREAKINLCIHGHWKPPSVIKSWGYKQPAEGTVQQRDVSGAAGRIPEWNRPSRRSTASDWPAPAAPLNSPGPWSRRSADSEKKAHGPGVKTRVTSANFHTFILSIMAPLSSLQKL